MFDIVQKNLLKMALFAVAATGMACGGSDAEDNSNTNANSEISKERAIRMVTTQSRCSDRYEIKGNLKNGFKFITKKDEECIPLEKPIEIHIAP